MTVFHAYIMVKGLAFPIAHGVGIDDGFQLLILDCGHIHPEDEDDEDDE